jgi:hypothetical protein
MELTQQQIKDLKKMSLVLNALNMEDGVCYEYSCDQSYWDPISGPTYRNRNVIDEVTLPVSTFYLIDEIRDSFDTSNFYDEYYDNENGKLTFCINANRKVIDVTYDHYVTNTETTSLTKTFKELTSVSLPWGMRSSEPVNKLFENPKFINEMFDKYGEHLEVTYEGGGDSGWIEDTVGSSKNKTDLDGRIEDIAYFLLEVFYSGWEINEGSNGNIIFNFKDQTFTMSHSMNYQEELEEDYMTIQF